MRKILLLYFALLMCLVVPVKAQLTLSFPELNADPGDRIAVDISVANFTDITVLQGTFEWDPAVVSLEKDYGIGIDTSAGFFYRANTDIIDQGRFLFTWADFSFTGVSLEDDEAVFTFYFNVVGDYGAQSPLNIVTDSTTGTPYLAGNAAGEIPSERINGMITVNNMTSTSGPITNGKITLHPNQPTPFSDKTLVQFDLIEGAVTTLSIFDVNGKLISEHTQSYGPGSHFISLEQQLFPASGTYVYQLQADGQTLVKRLTFIR